jgi:hypothetical protein
MAEWPHPKNTVVRCVTPTMIPVRVACFEHLFLTTSEPEKTPPLHPEEVATLTPEQREQVEIEVLGCGWRQSARCLVCGYETHVIDADFWYFRATNEDLDKCKEAISDDLDRLNGVYAGLEMFEIAPPRKLVNFDD